MKKKISEDQEKNIRIAITYSDNDFGNTFRHLMKTLGEAVQYRTEFPTDKKTICKMANALLFGMYLTFQHDEWWNETAMDRIPNYLVIKEKDILVNEEVDEFIKTTKWNNSETHVLYTTPITVFSI